MRRLGGHSDVGAGLMVRDLVAPTAHQCGVSAEGSYAEKADMIGFMVLEQKCLLQAAADMVCAARKFTLD